MSKSIEAFKEICEIQVNIGNDIFQTVEVLMNDETLNIKQDLDRLAKIDSINLDMSQNELNDIETYIGETNIESVLYNYTEFLQNLIDTLKGDNQ